MDVTPLSITIFLTVVLTHGGKLLPLLSSKSFIFPVPLIVSVPSSLRLHVRLSPHVPLASAASAESLVITNAVTHRSVTTANRIVFFISASSRRELRKRGPPTVRMTMQICRPLPYRRTIVTYRSLIQAPTDLFWVICRTDNRPLPPPRTFFRERRTGLGSN